ncbi:hypothetical protein ACF1BE_33065 [Streptomyces sp. NPDC014991]|uniref:hypothetical protein n=1 Tax=Streptomyces sp. NPDC014991 TaxID=3364935 RepID=UPI00370237C3
MGSFDSWFFHDTDADLDRWFAAMERRLELLLDRRPCEIDLYEEPVQRRRASRQPPPAACRWR